MSQNKLCKTCQFWLLAFSRDKQYGTCDNPIVEGKVLVDKNHDTFSEDTVLHTSEHFGCIYHSPVHNNVVTKIERDGKG